MTSPGDASLLVYREESQDLFKLDYKNEWCLCHCISKDLAMGKGIAVMFKQLFGGVDELRSQNLGVGDVGVLKSFSCEIYYLITKPRYFNKPTYQDLEKTLASMRAMMIYHNQTKLAMPMIGCGLDMLEWSRVCDLIQKVFAGSGIEILVCRMYSFYLFCAHLHLSAHE